MPSLCLLAMILYVFSNKIILVWFQISVSVVLLSFVLPGKQRDLFVYPNLSKSVGERAVVGQNADCKALPSTHFCSHVNSPPFPSGGMLAV